MTNSVCCGRMGLVLFGLSVGLVAGLVGSHLLEPEPAYAVATDRFENYAIATGWVDEDIEAIYFMDYATGYLRAAVLNVRVGKFTNFYEHNILADLQVDPDSNPRFLMVTGQANLAGGQAGARYGDSIVYVGEITSGRVVAYAIPWATGAATRPVATKSGFVALDLAQFRGDIVRE